MKTRAMAISREEEKASTVRIQILNDMLKTVLHSAVEQSSLCEKEDVNYS